VTPDDPGYSGEIAQWAVNAERPAGIVAFVKDTNDIALTLEYARLNNLQIAIRCGGLVVDLFCYFNYAVVDPEKRTARVGAGTLWATVEKEAIQHGLASVAGTVNHVRVALLMTCTSCLY